MSGEVNKKKASLEEGAARFEMLVGCMHAPPHAKTVLKWMPSSSTIQR